MKSEAPDTSYARAPKSQGGGPSLEAEGTRGPRCMAPYKFCMKPAPKEIPTRASPSSRRARRKASRRAEFPAAAAPQSGRGPWGQAR
eukprot:3404798-Pyramimonas_sp.AAC.1